MKKKGLKYKWLAICGLLIAFGLSACGAGAGADLDEVKNKDCEISFQGRKIMGVYSGQEKDGKNEGQGSFSSEEGGHRFSYEGAWKDGEITGKGSLWDDQFIIHFADGDRKGTYDGELELGEASGDGVFSAVNADKVSYTYSGGFESGLFEGEGKLVYDNDSYFVQKGNFHEGEFDPDNRDLITALGTGSSLPYKIDKEQGTFVEEHAELFPAAYEDGCGDYVKKAGDDLYKDVTAYKENLIKVTDRKVGQVFKQNIWGHDMTVILTWDKDVDKVHYIFYPEAVEDLKAGDAISYYALPLANSNYEMEDGGRQDCLVMFGSFLVRPDGSGD